MIYNASAAVSIRGNGNVTLSPTTSGTYAGITIFQNRSLHHSGAPAHRRRQP